MNPIARTFALVLAFVAAAPAFASAGGCGAPAATPAGGGNWQVEPSRKLYLLDTQGRLLEAGFAGKPARVISAHFDPTDYADGTLSPDGRWFVYAGGVDADTWEAWLYDLRTGTDRRLLATARWGTWLPRFSADSRTLATTLTFDDRNARSTDAALGSYLIDVRTATTKHLGLPPGITATKARETLDWPAQGDDFLLSGGVLDARAAWRVSREGRFRRIGWRHPKGREFEYLEHGQPIALVPEVHMPSHRGGDPQRSPNQARLAEVDRDQRLHVSERGKTRHVATGSYNECEGSTLRIAGWLDSRYLVYVISNISPTSYIYDAELGRSKKLFKDEGVVSAYFW